MSYVIAEIGFNHGGDVNLAVEMVESAAKAGVSAVKLQSFFATDLYQPEHEYFKYFKDGELTESDFERLKKVADNCGVDFLSTPFSPFWVDVLEKLNPVGYKIASMDINNAILLEKAAKTGRRIFLSTGASGIDEIKKAVSLIRSCGNENILVFHCVSNYPTKPKDAMLSMIPILKKELLCDIGFSDHTAGIAVPISAVALGAKVVEKHFTTSKTLLGGDNANSIEPDEMRALVSALNDAKEATREVEPADERADSSAKKAMRRGIYASRNIAKGDVVTIDSLLLIRPEVTPLEKLGEIVDAPAKMDYKMGEPI